MPIQLNSGLLFVIKITSGSIAETCSKHRVLEKLSPAAHGFERVNTAGQKNTLISVCKINTKSIINLHKRKNRGIMVFKVRNPWCFASSRHLLVFLVTFYRVRGECRKESREKVPAAKALN